MKKKSLLLILVTAGTVVGMSLAAASKAGVFLCSKYIGYMPAPLPKEKQNNDGLYYHDLYEKTRLITVKIIIPNISQGSGIIIQRQGQVYTVLTNEHVAKKGKSYIIKTYSGKEYLARPIETNRFGQNDLSLLEFISTDGSKYEIAKTGDSSVLRENDYVYAAGYPAESSPDNDGGFVFYPGRILFRLKKPLLGGYQVGISNSLEKGMSGGPLVNGKGEVVGIAGRHRALWGGVRNCSYQYEDLQPACDNIKVEPNSWKIMIETFLVQAPPSLELPPPSPFWAAFYEKRKASQQWRSAKFPSGWSGVASSWQRAIALLDRVPNTHPQYGETQIKIRKYRQNMKYALEMLEQSARAPQGLRDPYFAAISEAVQAWSKTQGKPEKTPQDWREIADLWDRALRFMQAVPANHPLYQEAQKKKSEYHRNMQYAQQQGNAVSLNIENR